MKATAAAAVRSTARERMIVYAMTGAAGTSGGIASANLNVLRVLQSLSNDSGDRLRVISLHEHSSDRPQFLASDAEFVGCVSNKWVFALHLLGSFRRRCVYLFDHVQLALPIVPLVAAGFREFVIFAHGSESWKRARRSSRWLFRRARLCLTNSQFTLRKMQNALIDFEGKSCLLGLPVNHVENTTSNLRRVKMHMLPAVDGKRRKLNDRVIFLVGRMDSREREKGHRELLRIWKDVLRDFPEAQLVFAGPGDDRASLARTAQVEGIASSVFIPGFLPTDVLKEIYRHCYAFVMPSRQEGFGLVFLEAMNAGKPCVGCLGGGCEEIVEDGKTGILLDNPLVDRQLLEALRRLLKDPALARRMGQKGLRRLRENFTADHAYQRLQQVLRELFQ